MLNVDLRELTIAVKLLGLSPTEYSNYRYNTCTLSDFFNRIMPKGEFTPLYKSYKVDDLSLIADNLNISKHLVEYAYNRFVSSRCYVSIIIENSPILTSEILTQINTTQLSNLVSSNETMIHGIEIGLGYLNLTLQNLSKYYGCRLASLKVSETPVNVFKESMYPNLELIATKYDVPIDMVRLAYNRYNHLYKKMSFEDMRKYYVEERVPVETIAKMLNVSLPTVYGALSRYNLKPTVVKSVRYNLENIRKDYETTLATINEISIKHSIPTRKLRKLITDSGWTSKRETVETAIINLANNGVTVSDIADQLDVKLNMVRMTLYNSFSNKKRRVYYRKMYLNNTDHFSNYNINISELNHYILKNDIYGIESVADGLSSKILEILSSTQPKFNLSVYKYIAYEVITGSSKSYMTTENIPQNCFNLLTHTKSFKRNYTMLKNILTLYYENGISIKDITKLTPRCQCTIQVHINTYKWAYYIVKQILEGSLAYPNYEFMTEQ